MNVAAIVDDLMDRSRITTALGGVTFTTATGIGDDCDIVVIDLARSADSVTLIRARHATVRIVGYAPHVDDDLAERAMADGADVVLARSRFFRDVRAAVEGA